MTLAELQARRCSWFGSEFGERPNHRRNLDFANKHDVVFYLEMKPSTCGAENTIDQCLRSQRNRAHPVTLFDAAILAGVRKWNPRS